MDSVRGGLGVALALALVLLAPAALLGACGSGGPTRSDYAGYWKAADEKKLGGPLLLRIDKHGARYSIAGLHFLGAAGDKATVKDGKLVAAATAPTAQGFAVVFELVDGGRHMTMSITTPGQTGRPMVSVDLVPATGARADMEAQLQAQEERARVTGVKEGVHAIQVGLQAWAVDHDGAYPPVAAVRPGGKLAPYVGATWPANPYGGATMKPGTRPGDYTYTLLKNGKAFKLSGHLAGGGLYTVP